MTVNHVFYIPLILALGALLGFYLAKRQLRIQQAQEERERRLLQQRRDERERRRAAESGHDATDG